MLTFLAAFNYLEASPPFLVGRFCDADAKGVSMGAAMGTLPTDGASARSPAVRWPDGRRGRSVPTPFV